MVIQQTHAATRGLQYVVVAVLGLAVVFLLSVLVTTVSEAGLSAQAGGQSRRPSAAATDNNPNVVAVGLGDATQGALQAVNSAAYGVQSGILSGAKAVISGGASAGAAVGGLVHRGAVATTGAVANGIGWLVRAPGNALGFVGDKSGAAALIQPKDSSQIPTIDPNDPIFHTAKTTKAAAPAAPAATVNDQTAAWPLRGSITTLFGVPHWPYQPTHTGLDISSGQRRGAMAIHPFRAGSVVKVVPAGINGLGNHVVIDHGNGLSSVYAHLDSIAVQAGQQVTTASVLGQEGTTGASTGPHLHLEIRQDGYPKNPLDYLGKQ